MQCGPKMGDAGVKFHPGGQTGKGGRHAVLRRGRWNYGICENILHLRGRPSETGERRAWSAKVRLAAARRPVSPCFYFREKWVYGRGEIYAIRL